MVIGGLFGAACGSLLALLYRRGTIQQRLEGRRLEPRKLVRIGMSLTPALRQLVDYFLGE
jgi:hypothetical protein